MSRHSGTRRDFLNPAAVPESAGQTDALIPSAGSTMRVATRAMACEFSVVLNPGPHEQVTAVGDVMELVHDIESWLSIYQSGSEISRVNANAGRQPVPVNRPLFEVLQRAATLFTQTEGAFDIASGAQVRLWRQCRGEQRVPTSDEIQSALHQSGSQHVVLDADNQSVGFGRDGLSLDPGAIGKGYALDECAEWLEKLDGVPDSFLVHGGHSSLVARGEHNGLNGWPVGIGNPLLTRKRLGTVLLQNQAMSTSGSNIQFFRVGGRRFGHILDPRTAWPVDGMLSVTVFSDSAAVADALSTAFFVLGVENARKCCDNLSNVGAILIPFPERGKRVKPVVVGACTAPVFWDDEQVAF